MALLKRIKQAIPEFKEQAKLISDTYGRGGGSFTGYAVCFGV